eukprot:Hpha_TRINITY_DN11229_c0_g2::TRINITY_DN11229_c0_g2_i1::g.167534::m.167534/K17914/KIF13; kinesin family member 13
MPGVPKVWLRVGDEDGHRYVADARADITQFKVFTRVRPFISEELQRFGDSDMKTHSVIEMAVEDSPQGPVETTYVCNPKENWRRTHSFTYDRCLWSIPMEQKVQVTDKAAVHKTWVNQAEMYKVAVTDPESGYSAVDNAFLGINAHLMTYGQTSSGKTYTMLGNYKDEADADRGIIPRVCDELFRKVQERREYEAKKADPNKRWQLDVTVSFVEIYCEKVRDLLTGGPRGTHTAGDVRGGQNAMKEARIRGEGTAGGPYLEGVEPKKVENWDDCKRLLLVGSKHRTTAATKVHDNSSRSHAIFTVTLTQTRDIQPEQQRGRHDRSQQEVKVGRMNLVDLAGSERSGGTEYQKEGSAINTSLLVLRKVIEALADRQQMRFEQLAAERKGLPFNDRPLPNVPQRESVLTRLLDLEGANAKAVMIANLTPSFEFYDETLRTLEWSHKSRRLVTVVRTNVSDSADVLEGRMAAANQRLYGKLADQKSNVDSLQSELKHRASMITELTARNEKTEARIQSLDERYRKAKEKRNATFIQLFFYRNMLKRVRERRQRELTAKEKQKAEEEATLRRVQMEYSELKESIKEQGGQMARLQQKAEYFMSAAGDTDKGGPTVNLEEMREKLAEQEGEMRKKQAELDQAMKEKDLAEDAFKRFEDQRSAQEERRKEWQEDQDNRLRKLQEDMFREVLAELTPDDVLGDLGVGPVPTDFAGAHPDVKYGSNQGNDDGLKVFEKVTVNDSLSDTAVRRALGNEKWVVSEELKRKTEEATRRLQSAQAEADTLAQQRSALESENSSLSQEKSKAQAEAKRLQANISALDEECKKLESQKGCC